MAVTNQTPCTPVKGILITLFAVSLITLFVVPILGACGKITSWPGIGAAVGQGFILPPILIFLMVKTAKVIP